MEWECVMCSDTTVVPVVLRSNRCGQQETKGGKSVGCQSKCLAVEQF